MRQPPHPWTAGRRPAHDLSDLDRLRRQILDLATLIAEVCPLSLERTEALAQLDAVAFHAVASFGRR